MRYDVKKFLFIGVESDREIFFKKAQDAGIIHFLHAQPKTHESAEIQSYEKAIKVLRGLPPTEQEEVEENGASDEIVQNIHLAKEKLERLEEEKRLIRLELERVETFGTFSMEEVADIEKDANRKIQFYCAKQGYAAKNPLPDEVIYVGSDHGLDFFVAINKIPTQYPKLIELNIEKSWGELKARSKQVEKEFHETYLKLKGYSKYNHYLHHAFMRRLNNYHLEIAKGTVDLELNQQLFVAEGWVPVHKIESMHQLVKEMNIYVEEIAFDPLDVPPTYLENQGPAQIGQDIIKIYDTPSHTDKDPSLWVLVFFTLFFSMIIGDAGYGLIFLLTALYVRYKYYGLKGGKKRLVSLMLILGAGTLIWGVLISSFFGISPPPDSFLRKFSLLEWLAEKKAAYHIQHKDDVYNEIVQKYPSVKDVTDPKQFLLEASSSKDGKVSYDVLNKFSDNIFLELALFIGVVHIILSFLRYIRRNPSGIGWILFLIGCYLYLPSFLQATSLIHYVFGVDKIQAPKAGLYLIVGGMSLAVIIALFRHKLFGLLEASNVIQIFGDVMSYLRLYALGLSGAMLSATLYDLAAMVNIVLSVVIIVAGHLVNMLLGVMGGVIHGLRLNFLEWYHYSFEGGGKMFNPLRRMEKDN